MNNGVNNNIQQPNINTTMQQPTVQSVTTYFRKTKKDYKYIFNTYIYNPFISWV